MSQPSTGEVMIDEARCLLEALHVGNNSDNINIVTEVLLTVYTRGYTRGSERALQILKEEIMKQEPDSFKEESND